MNRRLPFVVASIVILGACGGAAPDLPMRLVSSVPTEGAVDVDTATALTLRFSKPAAKGALKVWATPGPQFGRAYWTEGGTVVTLWAADALFPNSDYVLTIEAEASDGDPLPEGTALRFRTKRAFDIVAPTAALVTPSNGTLSAPRDTPIEILFSETMAVASVSVGVTPEVAMGPAEWSADLRTLTLRPVALLDWETRISIEVAGDDLGGHALSGATSFSFMVMREPDLTAPILIHSDPADGATGVGSMPKVTLEFSEAIGEESISLVLSPTVRASIPQWNDARTVVMFEATERLPAMASCQIQFQVQDLAGNVLAETVDFETGDPPRVIGVTPAEGATVGAEPVFEVRFSAPMAPETVVLKFAPSVTLEPLLWNAEADTARAAATDPLIRGADYRLTVAGQGASGDSLEGPFAFVFSVAPSPTLSGSVPTPLDQWVSPTSRLSLFFNVPMAHEGFRIDVEREDGVPVAAIAYDWVSPTAVDVTLEAALEGWRAYEVRGAGTSLYGDAMAPFSFSFHMASTFPPWVEVVRFTPTAGALNTPVRLPLILEFAADMDMPSVEAAFALEPPATCAWEWSLDWRSASCTPTTPLVAGVQYTATLGPGAQDIWAQVQIAPFQSRFTTAVADDAIAPTALSESPVDGGWAVSTRPGLTLQFSEPMDRVATEAALQFTTDPALDWSSMAWSIDSTELSWMPRFSNPAQGAQVVWSLSTAATDLAGLPLAQEARGAFRVARMTTEVVLPIVSAGFGTLDTAGRILPTMFLGDDVANEASRAFVTFDLGALASAPMRIVSARIDVRFKDGEGRFDTLGELRMASVDYGLSLSAEDFDGPVDMAGPAPWVIVLVDAGRYDVLDKVRADLEDSARGKRCQFRFEYTKPTNLDSVRDGRSLVGPGDPTEPSVSLIVEYEYTW